MGDSCSVEESHFPFLWRWLGAAHEPQRLSQASLWGFSKISGVMTKYRVSIQACFWAWKKNVLEDIIGGV